MNTPATPRSDLRRLVLTVTITSFAVAALMGIAALLEPGSFGGTEIRVLLTTVAAGCGSLLALCCMAVLGGRFQSAGVVGLMAVALTTLFSLLLIWASTASDSEHALRAWGLCVTASLSLAQVCLLLGLAGRRTSLAWLMWATVSVITLLAGLVSALLLGWDGNEGAFRLIGVVAILDVLGTLVAVAFGVFGRDDSRTVRDAGRVSVRPETAARLRALGEQTGRPAADLVDEAVSRYLGSLSD
jgi:predicted neutral ceramidase superfamily lipid hydrolase